MLIVLKMHARSMKNVHRSTGTKTTSKVCAKEDESGK
jgi:hypothetical protein